MRISLLPISVLAISAQGALASVVPQEARTLPVGQPSEAGYDAEVAKRKDQPFDGLERSKTECAGVVQRKTSESAALKAIDKLHNKPGNVQLSEPGCQLVACSGLIGAAIDVCWDPVEGAPDTYEKPWSYVADYAMGVVKEWCGRSVPNSLAVEYWVGGKVWDPAGLAVNVYPTIGNENC